jgi:hypothetical protein
VTNEVFVELPVNGSRNAVVKVFGVLSGDMPRQKLVDFNDLVWQDVAPKKLKIESFTFAIQEKLGFVLWWGMGEDFKLILPLESRGYLNWASIYSLHSPGGADSIWFESINWFGPVGSGSFPEGNVVVVGPPETKVFLFEMDIEKQ